MDHAVRLGPYWLSPAAMRRRWLAAIFAVSAVYAWLVVVVSSDSVHRTWGAMAAGGYAVALIAVLAWKSHGRDVALLVSFIGGLLAPMCWLIAHGLEQPEVGVVAESGAMLIRHGTPYASTAVLAATTNPNAYNPYLPVMSLFGVPHALADSPFTDPRIWFGLVFLVVFWLALRRAGAHDPARWTLLVTACPVIAFTLATGGDDVPIVGFLCLAFAYLWPESEPVKAGIALGIASAMKATVWPALAVAIALIAVRDGKRAVTRFTVAAAAALAVTTGPFLVHPGALIENTIKFPLGLASVISAAASPLPGHLIADTGHTGHTIVVALLALAGLGVAALLVFRPPRTVTRAMLILVGALTLMFLLAPSTRFGYFIYPMALVIWLVAAVAAHQHAERQHAERQAGGQLDLMRDPGDPPPSSRTSQRTSPVTPPAG
jgi:hypothetical protein